ESEPYKSRSREWNGDEAWIGAVLPVANSDKNSDKYHSMDAGLYWENDNNQSSVYCYSAFYTQTIAFMDELASRLEPQRIGKLSVEKRWSGLVLWEPKPLKVNS